jgi:acetyl esterase/lipase
MPLDPIIQSQLHILESIMPAELTTNPELAAAIGSFYQLNLPYDPPQVETREETIPGPRGGFRIRIYQPARATTPCPALVWAHGGGFISGTIDMHEADLVSREVCARAHAVVVSVDYHLANGQDVTYPVLHQEVTEAWLWTRARSAELGVDSAKIAVGGASAGANLAIAATLELRSRGEALPTRLALAYPFTHRTFVSTPESNERMRSMPPLLRFSQETTDGLFYMYLGAQTEAPFASVDDADFTGFPPILVIVSEFDDLRPGSEVFTDQARAAGVDVELYLARGVVHGHLNFTPALPEMDASLQKIADFVGGWDRELPRWRPDQWERDARSVRREP